MLSGWAQARFTAGELVAVGAQARFPICEAKKALHPLGFGEDEITSVAVSVQPPTGTAGIGDMGKEPRPAALPPHPAEASRPRLTGVCCGAGLGVPRARRTWAPVPR